MSSQPGLNPWAKSFTPQQNSAFSTPPRQMNGSQQRAYSGGGGGPNWSQASQSNHPYVCNGQPTPLFRAHASLPAGANYSPSNILESRMDTIDYQTPERGSATSCYSANNSHSLTPQYWARPYETPESTTSLYSVNSAYPSFNGSLLTSASTDAPGLARALAVTFEDCLEDPHQTVIDWVKEDYGTAENVEQDNYKLIVAKCHKTRLPLKDYFDKLENDTTDRNVNNELKSRTGRISSGQPNVTEDIKKGHQKMDKDFNIWLHTSTTEDMGPTYDTLQKLLLAKLESDSTDTSLSLEMRDAALELHATVEDGSLKKDFCATLSAPSVLNNALMASFNEIAKDIEEFPTQTLAQRDLHGFSPEVISMYTRLRYEASEKLKKDHEDRVSLLYGEKRMNSYFMREVRKNEKLKTQRECVTFFRIRFANCYEKRYYPERWKNQKGLPWPRQLDEEYVKKLENPHEDLGSEIGPSRKYATRINDELNGVVGVQNARMHYSIKEKVDSSCNRVTALFESKLKASARALPPSNKKRGIEQVCTNLQGGRTEIIESMRKKVARTAKDSVISIKRLEDVRTGRLSRTSPSRGNCTTRPSSGSTSLTA